MLFNSVEFIFFFLIVFFSYWFLFNKNLKFQNLLILFSSYFFYAWWDWRFLVLIIISSLTDYLVGLQIEKSNNKIHKLRALKFSLIINIGILVVFKYYNFFIDNFTLLLDDLDIDSNLTLLNIILPVGISFYTFQTLSYSIDIYNGKINANKDIISFFAFVAFFPQLVAGPIERAKNLLPQFLKERKFNYDFAISGCRLILIGLFKKMVIADNLSVVVDAIYANPTDFLGFPSLIATIFFAFQIYCDFSGYSDIAIGIARLLGFKLMTNFKTPYFSKSLTDFWRNWHISLSSWFKDYVYIPLGGGKMSEKRIYLNIMITFLLSGFWHGANWTFIIWGALNAIYFLPLLLTNNNRKNLGVVAEGKLFPSFRELFAMLTTFMLTVFAWIFFRSEDLNHAFSYIGGIFSKNILSIPSFEGRMDALITMVLISIFLLIEWLGRNGKYGIEQTLISNNIYIRVFIYFLLVNMILLYTKNGSQAFIYFQF